LSGNVHDGNLHKPFKTRKIRSFWRILDSATTETVVLSEEKPETHALVMGGDC